MNAARQDYVNAVVNQLSYMPLSSLLFSAVAATQSSRAAKCDVIGYNNFAS